MQGSRQPPDRRGALKLLGGAAIAPLVPPAFDRAWPNRSIRPLIGVPAGGTHDSREVPQQLIVNGTYPIRDGAAALRKTMHDDTERCGRITRPTNLGVSE